MALDGDAALLLQVHVVKHLILHLTLRDGVGVFQKTVGQRALAMVDVGDYAEIAYTIHFLSYCQVLQIALWSHSFPQAASLSRFDPLSSASLQPFNSKATAHLSATKYKMQKYNFFVKQENFFLPY
jgi:hypothetical protein